MRAPTTIRTGPVHRAKRRPPGRLDSHRTWTDRRGPVNYTNDLAYSQTQANTTQCFGLDADQRLATSTTYNAVNCSGSVAAATVNHYDNSSDSPDWVANNLNGSWTANLLSVTGGLAAIVDQAGAVTYQYLDLHGDVAATATAGGLAADVAPDYGEFGDNPDSTPAGYGWLGGKRRSAQDQGGLILMGVRLYDPILGRFLQVDPFRGGNLSAYDYCDQDPVNSFDLGGQAHVTPEGDNGPSGWAEVEAVFKDVFGGNWGPKLRALVHHVVKNGRFGSSAEARRQISRTINDPAAIEFDDPSADNFKIDGDGWVIKLNRGRGPGTIRRSGGQAQRIDEEAASGEERALIKEEESGWIFMDFLAKEEDD